MLPRLLALAIAGLLLPTASASDLPAVPTPDSIAHVLPSGLVSISYTINPAVDTGDVVPLCDDAPDVPEGWDVLGSIVEGCFQPTSTDGKALPIIGCYPVGASVLSPTFPHVGANPDEQCIESIPEHVTELLSKSPVNIFLILQK